MSSKVGRDPHDILGVPEGADRQQVMRAFHRKARRGGHPDTGGDAQTFDEIVRARDVLLDEAQRRAAYESRRRAPQAATGSNAKPQPPYAPPRTYAPPRAAQPREAPANDAPPREPNGLAIVTVVLALLGPFMWPFAIITGHLALLRIKRTGQGGGTLVPIVLFFLYVLTVPVLLRILSIVVIP